jgi:hypothetical protein
VAESAAKGAAHSRGALARERACDKEIVRPASESAVATAGNRVRR